MSPTVPRALFGVALATFAISEIQNNVAVFRIRDELDGGFQVPPLGFLQIALLALPIFFTGKKAVTVISVMWVYLIELLGQAVLLQRDLIDPFSAIFMIPSYTLELSFESLVLGSSAYLKLISFISAIIGTVLVFVGVQKENPRSTSVNLKKSGTQIFIPARELDRQLLHINKSDEIDQVDRLGDLLKKGLITQEEFEFKKRQILGL